VSSKLTATLSASLNRILFALPETTFCSCTTVGIRNNLADSTTGKDTYPPNPTQHVGLKIIVIHNAFTESKNSLTKNKSTAGDILYGSLLDDNSEKATPSFSNIRLSMALSDPTNFISHDPRAASARFNAMAGNI